MPDVNQIRFKAGTMQHFITTKSFALGAIGQIPKGADIYFDGSKVEFGGTEYSFPQFRAALRQGWAVLEGDYEEGNPEYDRKVSANIQVRHATNGGNPMQPQQRMSIATTESDERQVGTVGRHAQNTKDRNANYRRGDAPNTSSTNMGVEVEEQDGVPVRTLKTAAGEKAKQARTTLTAGSVGETLRQANSSGVIDPGEGITQEEMLERMPDEDRAIYLAQLEAKKSQYVDEPPMAGRKVVGRVISREPQQREGGAMTSRVSTAVGSVAVADMAGMAPGVKPKESVLVEDGITFRNTNGPEKLAPQVHPREASRTVQGQDVRRQIAKLMCPDFPDNYDFAVSPRKKIARLMADYEDRPDVIKAVYAAESDDFKAALVEEFPQAFGG